MLAINKKIKRNTIDIIHRSFESHVPDIIDSAKSSYEDNLLGIVITKDSLSNPAYFYDDFIDRIEDFNYIYTSPGKVELHLPNTETFDFSGKLTILKFIVEGVAGKYFELREVDLNTILKTKGVDDKVKRRLRDLPGVITDDVPLDMRFRLIPSYSSLMKTVQGILDKKLVLFPFSNSPPINLFEDVKEYVDSNISDWIKDSIDEAIREEI